MKPGLLFVASAALVAFASEAGAAGPREGPAVIHPVTRPPGVPEDYVLTHHGFFHPSCVVSVTSGDTFGGELAPCLYPRFTTSGQLVGPDEGRNLVHEHAHDTWDGWLVYYEDDGKVPIPVAPTLTTEWVVPPPPVLAQGQDVAFFNGIKTSAGTGVILQPVLDFNELPGNWIIFSEQCCFEGHDVQAMPPIVVTPGDTIRGAVAGRECRSDGVCESWTITTTDVTTGQSSVLNVTAPVGAPVKVHPGVLETYDLYWCDMLPASGGETFTKNELQDGHGHATALDYTLHVPVVRPAGVPSCGYGGDSKGDAYELLFRGAVAGAVPDFADSGGCQCTVAGAAPSVDWWALAALAFLLSCPRGWGEPGVRRRRLRSPEASLDEGKYRIPTT